MFPAVSRGFGVPAISIQRTPGKTYNFVLIVEAVAEKGNLMALGKMFLEQLDAFRKGLYYVPMMQCLFDVNRQLIIY